MTVKINNEEFRLHPRAAEIVRWIIAKQADFAPEQIPFGSLRFNLAGRKVQPEMTRSDRAIEVEENRIKVKTA